MQEVIDGELARPFFPDPIDEVKMNYHYFGCSMQQNRYALLAISILLEHTAPARMLEFGTRFGGLSVFLGMYAKIAGAAFHTYDIENQVKYSDFFNFLNIAFHIRDIFSNQSRQEITDLIRQPGRTILFCDAIKAKEFNLYADHLKSNDIILAHDYAANEQDFNSIKKQRIWWHCEIDDSDIAQACHRNHLVPVFKNLFRTAAWCCFIKKDPCFNSLQTG